MGLIDYDLVIWKIQNQFWVFLHFYIRKGKNENWSFSQRYDVLVAIDYADTVSAMPASSLTTMTPGKLFTVPKIVCSHGPWLRGHVLKQSDVCVVIDYGDIMSAKSLTTLTPCWRDTVVDYAVKTMHSLTGFWETIKWKKVLMCIYIFNSNILKLIN